MHDAFEVELQTEETEKAYAIACSAVREAQLTLQLLCKDPAASPELIFRAQERCEERARRRTALGRMLDESQNESPSVSRWQPATARRHRWAHSSQQPRCAQQH